MKLTFSKSEIEKMFEHSLEHGDLEIKLEPSGIGDVVYIKPVNSDNSNFVDITDYTKW